MGRLMDRFMSNHYKNQIDLNHDLIKIIQFCLKGYNLLIHLHHGWMYG